MRAWAVEAFDAIEKLFGLFADGANHWTRRWIQTVLIDWWGTKSGAQKGFLKDEEVARNHYLEQEFQLAEFLV